MATSASIGYGSKFQIGTSATPPVWTDIAEVTSITPPALSMDTVDATHMGSPDGFMEYIAGLIDAGEASMEMSFLPANAGQVALITAMVGRTEGNYRILYSDAAATPWVFKAFVTGFEVSSAVVDKTTATVTFKVNGKPDFVD
jgi:hypothetical protein